MALETTTTKVEQLKDQIFRKKIDNINLYFNLQRSSFIGSHLKKHPVDSIEFNICLTKLDEWYESKDDLNRRFFSEDLVESQVPFKKIMFLHQRGLYHPGAFFFGKNESMFNQTICRDPTLFIKMASQKDFDFKWSSHDQLFDCLDQIKNNEPAVHVFAQKWNNMNNTKKDK